MIESIAKSKNTSEKHKMGYKNLKFFVNTSQNRLQRVKSGCRLAHVLEAQVQENQEASYYVDLENAALRLIKTGKGFDDRSTMNDPQRAVASADPEETPDKRKKSELSNFNYAEYYKNQGFDPRTEISKERRINEFFKQKYKFESVGLAEDNLRNFLNDNLECEMEELPSVNANEPIEGKDRVKASDVNIMTRIREPILKQMEMLDEEIKIAVAKEAEMKKEKQQVRNAIGAAAYKNFKLKAQSPAKLFAGKPLTAENEEGNSELLLDRATLRKIEKLYKGTEKDKTPKENNRQIISQILDVGRLDFLKTQKPSSRGFFTSQLPKVKRGMVTTAGWFSPKNFQTPSATYYASGPVQASSAVSKIAVSKIGFPSTAEIKHQSLFALPETSPEKMQTIAKLQQASQEQFMGCKEFRHGRTQEGFTRKSVVTGRKSERNIGGTVKSHISANPLRYQCLSEQRDFIEQKVGSVKPKKEHLGNLLGAELKKASPFLQNVENAALNMKGVWGANKKKHGFGANTRSDAGLYV